MAERIGGVADAEGRARLPAPVRQSARRTAVIHPGYGQQYFYLQQSGSTLPGGRVPEFVAGEPALRLRSTGRITGRLIANQSELVSGIPVKVETGVVEDNAAADRLKAWGQAEATTDTQGRFVIRELALGRIELRIDIDPRLPVRPRIPDRKRQELKKGETLDLEIPLEMCVRVHGQVCARETGQPLDASVFLRYGTEQLEQAETDEKGHYMAFVLPGSVSVWAGLGQKYIADPESRRKTCVVPGGVEDFELPPIEAVPATVVSGTLLDTKGKPLAGARVGGMAGNAIYGWNPSDGEGKFSLGPFPVGLTFDSLSIQLGDECFHGKVESTDPLVVRLQPDADQTEGKEGKAMSLVAQRLIESIAGGGWTVGVIGCTAVLVALGSLLRAALAPIQSVGLAMARPSSARRRIEALHRSVYAAGLPRWPALAALAAGLIAAGLLGTTSLTRAAGDSNKESARATISGTVHNAQGRPVIGATVQIHSAGVRVGTSLFCPTCYADCGKNSKTDQQGRFAISSLDPTLVFRLLVIAEGYEPKTLEKVDPQRGNTVDARLAARPTPQDPACIVRGVVFDPEGKPAVGAVVEPFGCKTAEKRWWGVMPGVDALALTDSEGKFVIVCAKPVEGLDLRVEARGAARRNFELVYSGLEHHRLELEAGTTVQGRIVQDGRGVPGLLIGVVQADRGLGFLGTYKVQTDAAGRFALPNLPAGEELQVYGIMDSLRDIGAVASKQFKSADKGVSDLGDLPVVPACRLAGRLVLSDDRPVPAHTRVMIGRLQAWDTTFVEADAEGRFVAVGIPAESITMHVAIPGYRLSPKNRSFEPLNATGLQGLVEGDIDDLIVLFEPGQPLRPDFANQAVWRAAAEKRERLRNFPLAGVTADLETPEPPPVANPAATTPSLPKIEVPATPPVVRPSDAGPAKVVTGVVTDFEGKPLAGAQVWLPIYRLTSTETLTATVRSDDEGRFRLTIPEAWLPSNVMRRESTVWAYAPGHAIGTVNAYKQLFRDNTEQPCVVALPPVSDISFVLLSAEGQPAVGATAAPGIS